MKSVTHRTQSTQSVLEEINRGSRHFFIYEYKFTNENKNEQKKDIRQVSNLKQTKTFQ